MAAEHPALKASSAGGLLAMLKETHPTLKLHALTHLNAFVDYFWPEVADCILLIKSLYEDEDYGQKELAALLLLSKVFLYLGELNDSLSYALGAGPLFDVSEDSDYVRALLAKAIDKYAKLKTKAAEMNDKSPVIDPRMEAIDERMIDPRMEAIVERMLDKCTTDGKYRQTIGMAIECRRLDKLEEAVVKSDNVHSTINYCIDVCHSFVKQLEYRRGILRLMVKIYQQLPSPDYLSMCQHLMFLDEPDGVATILYELLRSDNVDDALLAFQIAFDLVENENPAFLLKVRDLLPSPKSQPAESAQVSESAQPDSAETEIALTTEDAQITGVYQAGTVHTDPVEAVYAEGLPKIIGILDGETSIQLMQYFLHSHNKSDLLILKTIKQSVVTRNRVCHTAIVYANAIMHAGTSVVTFLSENMDWVAKATHWAKFSTTAGLGVIYRGQLQQGRSLMAPYLPQDGGDGGCPYSQSGALYALGLIHANHGKGVTPFLLETLRRTKTEVIQHGACLALGLVALGTTDEEVYEEVNDVFYADSAVASQAAGISLGLVMAGTATEMAWFMLADAHETQHEKIIRGLAFGIALTVYGREEEADRLIEKMTSDQDPVLRYGGIYALALAYRGTSNNKAIRKLLHFSVSDASDDVKRTAVLALGFVLYSDPEQCPRTVSLSSTSYNPHIRYGAALAVGIACAGTGLSEAISLLEPLTSDVVDFVRQGALIAMAMVMVQISEASDARAGAFRRQLREIIMNEHEDNMSVMGAILASGIIDAGGRNVTIKLLSKTKHDRMTAVVGLAVFSQYWFWHPFLYFISLAFSPTALIGVNDDLNIPKFNFLSQAKPSLFAYPKPTTVPMIGITSNMHTAILSTSLRDKISALKKESGRQAEEMKAKMKQSKKLADKLAKAIRDRNKEAERSRARKSLFENIMAEKAETSPVNGKSINQDGDSMQVDNNAEEKTEPEPSYEVLTNPARVVLSQEKFIKFFDDSRYTPVKKASSGIVVFKYLQPDEPDEFSITDMPSSLFDMFGGSAPPGQQGPATAMPVDEEPAHPPPFVFSS
ncbi:26S proteasome non-ATPase regulatory subunit 1 homolog A-like isoform X1 [Salvia splendens]|uniref:26S proteasome non-ATPase regulatory subunit 1 homolog A-like isoform X1 n=1 Tax=Salvia splendens TaxID=180675 RepID=UPI001C273E83|nr:26S proteasome non-ATPase regulatory subunit 1 homolog A-like isoform X1 [Salvia splendens]